MKRFLVLVVLGIAAALAVWFGMRSGSPKISSTTVTALLPRETLALLHVADVREARAQWHQSDIYKLWREPAVQAFLQKPLTRNPRTGETSAKLQQLEAIGARDAFLAIVSWQEDRPQFVGGFRFNGNPDDVKRILPNLREHAAQAEAQTYQQHQIEVIAEGGMSIATVYTDDWFFAANDMAALRALLDRVDGRVPDAAATLRADENFAAAFKHMPRSYVAFAYGRLDEYLRKLAARTPRDGTAAGDTAGLGQVRSIAAATGFEDGKVRDVLYLGMPKLPDQPDLARTSLSLATAESFLYAASFAKVPEAQGSADQQMAGFQGVVGRFLAGVAASGVTAEDWRSAFGVELGIVGEWPPNARIPSLLATLPVRDGAKARQIMRALTVGSGAEETRWTLSDKGGVQYCFQAPSSPMVPVAATIAVSDQLLVAGSDPGVVETTMTRENAQTSGLGTAQLFKTAERFVPAAKSAFVYVDTALLYTRLDAAVRPMLVLAATFMPSIAETIELQKLPPAEVVTKHLSPLVLSQSYEGDGYVTESVGPVSIYYAGAGIAIAAGFGTEFYQAQFPAGTDVPDEADADAAADLAPASPSPTPGP